MDYLGELKEKIYVKSKELGVKLLPKGNSLRLVKDMKIIMTLSDKGDYIEMSYGGQTYKYDKWYTKPEHLSEVIIRQLETAFQAEKK